MEAWLAERRKCERRRSFLVGLVCFVGALGLGGGWFGDWGVSVLIAADPDRAVTADVHESFMDARRILEVHCRECHGAEVQQAELDLSSLAGLARGGESGPVVHWGDADASELVQRVRSGEMPPDGKTPLTEDERLLLERWVAESAEPTAEAMRPVESGADGATVVHDVPRGDADEAPEESQAATLMVLRRHCVPCHGRHRQEAGLDLRSKASLLRGGKSGAAIVPGQPDESLLVRKLREGQMPPRERLIEASVKPVDPAAIDLIAAWIAAGAPEIEPRPDVATEEADRLVTDEDRSFWAFRPPQRAATPRFPAASTAESSGTRVRNPIDTFVLARLREAGLECGPEADRATLIRRVTFDLTGLPPTPEEVRAFLEDSQPAAYERLVDRLLASPRFGERWARFWLDLAGYADSEGKREQDLDRPHAWRYRDYVIRALNADKPYDRFLQEQLAGDELADYSQASEVTPEVHDNLVATGFLRMVPDATWANITGFLPDRVEVIAEEMDVLGSAVFGLTLKCARCHTHKFDPIPQRDYYRLVDVLKGALDEYDWMKPDIPRESPALSRDVVGGRQLPHVPAKELAAWRERDEQLKAQIAGLQEQLRALESSAQQQAGGGSPERSAADEMARLKAEIQKLVSWRQPEPRVQALWDRGEPSPTYIYRRGDPLSPGRLVGPGVPSVLTDGRSPFEVQPPWPGATSTGRRLALARWLTTPDHPLTARVHVNRLWRYHFGTGIVRTLDNFGKAGAPPTHPELLDWLATEFVRRGWSQKELHRLMVTSATYRRSSRPTAEARRLDPGNQWLSHMSMTRLNAEALYDAQLAVAGALLDRPYGQADWVTQTAEGLATPASRKGGWRRLVYVQQRRKQIVTFRETFDFPQMNPNCVERRDSIVAPQALYLMNNGHVWELAERFAARVRAEVGDEAARQVDRAAWLAWGREASEQERRVLLESMAVPRPDPPANGAAAATGGAPELDPLVAVCHALLNSAAFSHLD